MQSVGVRARGGEKSVNYHDGKYIYVKILNATFIISTNEVIIRKSAVS